MLIKKCSTCGDEKEEKLFRKNRNQCLKCRAKYNKEYNVENREDIMKNKREYREKNINKIREYQRKYKREYRKDSDEKIKNKCRDKTAWLIKKGEIKREPCKICKDINSEAHHVDYSNPFIVTWLCNKHHHEEHRNLRNNK